MAWASSIVRGIALVGILSFSIPAAAQIYRWIDESGKMHFTQDLGQVPARYRALSKSAAEAPQGRSRVQHYTPPKSPARLDPARRSSVKKPSGKTHYVRVQRAGSSMRVRVRSSSRDLSRETLTCRLPRGYEARGSAQLHALRSEGFARAPGPDRPIPRGRNRSRC